MHIGKKYKIKDNCQESQRVQWGRILQAPQGTSKRGDAHGDHLQRGREQFRPRVEARVYSVLPEKLGQSGGNGSSPRTGGLRIPGRIITQGGLRSAKSGLGRQCT